MVVGESPVAAARRSVIAERNIMTCAGKEEACMQQRTASIIQRTREGSLRFQSRLGSGRILTFRSKLQYALFENPEGTLFGRIYHNLFLVVIVCNLIGLMLETLDGPNHFGSDPYYYMLPYAKSYIKADMLFTGVFTFDIILKCVLAKSQKKFWTSAVTIIDILAVLPLYIIAAKAGTINISNNTEFQHQSEQYIKLLRLFRIIRVVTMLKHRIGMRILFQTAKGSFAPLSITLFFLITFIMLFATILYYAQPCYNVTTCTFTDIFNAGYFVMVTVATVGYGDQVPEVENFLALLVSSVVMIFGALYLAMPLAIVGIKYELLWTRFEIERKNKIRAESYKKGAPNSDTDDLFRMQIKSTRLAPMGNRLSIQFVDLCELVGILSRDCNNFVSLVNPEKLITCPPDKNRDDGATKLVDSLLRVLHIHKSLSKDVRQLVPRDILKPSPMMKPPSPSKLSETSPSRHSTFKKNMITRAKRALSNATNCGEDEDHHAIPQKDPQEKVSIRRRIYLLLERPNSSRQASYFNTYILITVIMSMVVFYAQTAPELQSFGTRTELCHRAMKAYCTKTTISPISNPGCYVQTSQNTTTNTLVSYDCGSDLKLDNINSSLCFAAGWNYGSNASILKCENSFSNVEQICNLRQCQDHHVPMFDMAKKWIFIESYFAIIFTVELFLRLYASKRRGPFLRSFSTLMDVLAIAPFYVEVVIALVRGHEPVFEIVATFPTFLTVMPITKALRIFKLARHLKSTRVLAQTARLTVQRLMIPLFFLFLGCICAGAIFYEIERGTQCFARMVCSWWDRNVMTKEIGEQFPEGKRIQIQIDKLTIVEDMVHSTWMSIVTFTTVGYGDMKPRTPVGKLVDIVAMVFGSCYTAMPLTLIGGQFYSCYTQYLKEQDNSVKRGEGSITDSKIDEVIARKQHRRSVIGHIDAPMLNQFMTLSRLLNEVILNTHRLNAMALQPAKLTSNGLPLSPLLESAVQGVERVRRLSSAPRKGSDKNGLIDTVREATIVEQKVQSAETILQNITAACEMANTIVLNFSTIVEKIALEDEEPPPQRESVRRASIAIVSADTRNLNGSILESSGQQSDPIAPPPTPRSSSSPPLSPTSLSLLLSPAPPPTILE